MRSTPSDLLDILNFIDDLQQILGDQDSSVVDRSYKFHAAFMGKLVLVGQISQERADDIMKKIIELNDSLHSKSLDGIGIRDRCNMI